MTARFYRNSPNCGVRISCPVGEAWLYAGRSFDLGKRVQGQRFGGIGGYVQLAYGRVRHFGLPARRTLGLQITRWVW